MKRIRYSVAMSLDGYIAGPRGESDWIIMDPDIDFGALFNQFDAVLLGRKTFESVQTQGGGEGWRGMEVYVFSRTLQQTDHPGVTIVAENAAGTLTALKKKSGKDIWLMGGGNLFSSLLDLRMVDTVEVAVIPVVLGAGIPLLPPPGKKATLMLTNHTIYKRSGTVSLEYAVLP